MTDNQKQLFERRVNEILFYVWDPIGVADFGPEARDEYDPYADHVWRMALAGQTKEEISDYLTEVVVYRMSLHARKQSDDHVAELVLDWKDFFENPDRLGYAHAR